MGKWKRRDIGAEAAREKGRRQHDVAAVRDDQGSRAISQTPRDRLLCRQLLPRKAESVLVPADELENVL